MQQSIIKLKSIEVLNLNSKESKAEIKIIFEKNSILDSITNEYFIKSPIVLTNKILTELKSKHKIIVDQEDEDITKNIFITKIHDEESTEDRMVEFFKKLNDKAISLRTNKDPSRHLELFKDIRIFRMSF